MTHRVSDRLYLGWHFDPLLPDPGQRPAPPASPGPDLELAAMRRRAEEALRPWRNAATVAAVIGVLCAAAAAFDAISRESQNATMFLLLALGATGLFVLARVVCNRRLAKLRLVEAERAAAAKRAHERAMRAHQARVEAWEAARRQFQEQTQWWSVAPRPDLQRIDVVGGVPSGWSAEQGAPAGWDALLTTYCATRVEVGCEVTVLDLTGSAVAQTALELFGAAGVSRAAYVLPRELHHLHVVAGASKELMHEILANLVHVAEENGTLAGWAQDADILRRVIDCYPDAPSMGQVLAGLRVLTQVGDVREDLASGLLTAQVLNKLNALFGERAIQAGLGDRLLRLLTHLEPLAAVSTEPLVPRDVPLKVCAIDRRAPAVTGEVLRAFLVSAFTAMVNHVPPGKPWARSIVVCGADRIPMLALRRLQDACSSARVGLLFMYETLGEQQRTLIGKGNAGVVFMRLGSSGDAKFASEYLGTEYRFVLSQMTETVGTSVTDTTGDSYSETVGTSKTMSENWGTSSSRGFSGRLLGTPNRSSSTNHGFSESLTHSESTTWGRNSSRALGQNNSNARTLQRSRENLVEPHELQSLPPTAFIYSRMEGKERVALLGDANPQISQTGKASAQTAEEGRLELGSRQGGRVHA